MKEIRLNIGNKSWRMKNDSMTLNLKGSKTPRFGKQQNEQPRNEHQPKNEQQPKFGQRNENKGFGKLNIPNRKTTGVPNIPNLFEKKSGNSNSKFNWKKL